MVVLFYSSQWTSSRGREYPNVPVESLFDSFNIVAHKNDYTTTRTQCHTRNNTRNYYNIFISFICLMILYTPCRFLNDGRISSSVYDFKKNKVRLTWIWMIGQKRRRKQQFIKKRRGRVRVCCSRATKNNSGWLTE